jgi:hypothetical protein
LIHVNAGRHIARQTGFNAKKAGKATQNEEISHGRSGTRRIGDADHGGCASYDDMVPTEVRQRKV